MLSWNVGLRNMGNCLPRNTVLHHRRLDYLSAWLWKPQISQYLYWIYLLSWLYRRKNIITCHNTKSRITNCRITRFTGNFIDQLYLYRLCNIGQLTDMCVLKTVFKKERAQWNYSPNHCLRGLPKLRRNVMQDIQSFGWHLNLAPLRYKAQLLTTEVQCAV